MVNSGILVMLHITLSDVICERMMLNLSAIVMLTAGVLSILHPHQPGICDQLPPPGAGIGSHSAPDHYREAATGNEKSEPMISSSDGGPVMAMEQFVVQIAVSPLPSFSFRRRD